MNEVYRVLKKDQKKKEVQQNFVDKEGKTRNLFYDKITGVIKINGKNVGVKLCDITQEYTTTTGEKIGELSSLGNIIQFFNTKLLHKPNFVY